MDKIPAALQHKIDYVNALDIPDESKAQRIAISVCDYWIDNLKADLNTYAKCGKDFPVPSKPIINEDFKFKREQPSGWYLAGCFLCVFILSASLGVILERSL